MFNEVKKMRIETTIFVNHRFYSNESRKLMRVDASHYVNANNDDGGGSCADASLIHIDRSASQPVCILAFVQ